MLTVGGVKMAKSEGNFITVGDALAEAPGEVIRLALLGTHYRDPLDWTADRLRQARQTLDRWYRALNIPPFDPEFRDFSQTALPPDPTDDLRAAVGDDLNTPLAIVHLHEQAKAIYREEEPAGRWRLQERFIRSARFLGLIPGSWLSWAHGGSDRYVAGIRDRIDARTKARKERRFADADLIRAELAEEKIILEDRPDGTTGWRSII
jgi:cysteinyl-tRNA synthetase